MLGLALVTGVEEQIITTQEVGERERDTHANTSTKHERARSHTHIDMHTHPKRKRKSDHYHSCRMQTRSDAAERVNCR